jgi:hypothetical protein
MVVQFSNTTAIKRYVFPDRSKIFLARYILPKRKAQLIKTITKEFKNPILDKRSNNPVYP